MKYIRTKDGIYEVLEIYTYTKNKLGEWHNDHIDCKFRAKSMGSYEYIENEEYTPVVRGYTKLDDVKDRANWEWGDIYQKEANIKNYKFVEGKGIIEI